MLEAHIDSLEQSGIRELEVVELPLSGKKKTGRPLRLTQARFNRMLELIRQGSTNTAACRVERVSYSSWRDHVQHKPEWQTLLFEAERVPDEVWKDFALETIRSAMPKHWVAAMTFLERKWPLEYSLRVPNRPNTEPDAPEPPLPSEVLEHHRRLMLELREDAGKTGS